MPTCTRRQSSNSSTPHAASARATAAGMSSAGRPSRGPPLDLGPKRATRRGEVGGAELVALADGCTDRDTRAPGRSRSSRSAATARLDHAELEAAVAGVHDADRVVARERDRRAVGGDHRERQTRAPR